MHDPDIRPLITRLAKRHAVDFENLDEEIKAMIYELAVDALDCKRMAGALSPRATTNSDPDFQRFSSGRGTQ